MPAPQAQNLSAGAKQYFAARNIKLPMKWRPMGQLYPGAFDLPERRTPAGPPNALYHEPTLNKYHTESASGMSRHYAGYIDGICAAIAKAIGTWMQTAMVVGINAVGPLGTWMPNGVNSPDLYPMIMADAPTELTSDFDYSQAIAAAISTGWNDWHQGLSGTLAYPGFNGAPMANTPAPVMSLMSAGEGRLAPEPLSREMQRNFDDPVALHAVTLFDAVAHAFYTQFQQFKAATLVSGVTVAAASAPPPPVPAPAGTVQAPSTPPAADPASEAADSPEAEDSGAEETETLEEEPEPLEPLPPAPSVAGTVIPTPGNFI